MFIFFKIIDILDASPPCTLFSNINKTADKYKGVKRKFKEGQKEQTLDDLFFETICLQLISFLTAIKKTLFLI
jgi:site-specific DNA-cytosine methylase